jgi:hypothetical protein
MPKTTKAKIWPLRTFGVKASAQSFDISMFCSLIRICRLCNITNVCITFLSSVGGVLLPSQKSMIVNRENTNSLVTSPFTKIEFKSFPGIIGRYLLVFADVPFYMTRSIPSCSRILCAQLYGL